MRPLARLLLTRPAAQAGEWLQRLSDLGVPAASLPLIAIEPAPPAAARQAWQALGGQRLAMFVSPNAVTQFFAQRPAGQAWPATTLAATVGPGSARALLAQGVPEALIVQPAADAPALDSEHLWPELLRHVGPDWRGLGALLVRGDGGREWLADRLREAGARVQACSVYRRACPRLDAAGQALLDAALVRPREHVWLFSSSEAIGHLQQLAAVAPQASPRPAPDWSAGLALATHERIAARAQALGFGHVVLVRPDATAVARGWRRLSGSTLESDAL